jgi:hypothetical protein
MIIAVYFVTVAVKKLSFIFFFSCPFSQDCWNSLHIYWNDTLDPLDMIIEESLAIPFSKNS